MAGDPTKIGDLPALVTPASTDDLPTEQANVTYRTSRSQVHTLESGEQFTGEDAAAGALIDEAATATNPTLLPNKADVDTGIGATVSTLDQLSLIAGGVQVANLTEDTGTVQFIVPLQNDSANPSIAFGDGNTGFYESGDNVLQMSLGGTPFYAFDSGKIQSVSSGGLYLRRSAGVAATPVFAFKGDLDTGMYSSTADRLSFAAGGVDGIHLIGDTTDVIIAHEANVGLTAHTDSIQGVGVITSSKNVYSTVAVAGDAATLPATFIVGTEIYVQNDGAQSMDVFPASGDTITPNAGDAAEAVAAGVGALFIATTANATWSRMRLN